MEIISSTQVWDKQDGHSWIAMKQEAEGWLCQRWDKETRQFIKVIFEPAQLQTKDPNNGSAKSTGAQIGYGGI